MMLVLGFIIFLLNSCVLDSVSSRHMQRQRQENIKNCVSKFYNREFGPLEILMLPLGEKLWLRAWLGNHMTNLLHMEGVDLAEVTQLATEQSRTKRSYLERNESHSALPRHVIPNSYRVMLQPFLQQGIFQGRVQINITSMEATDRIVLHAHKELQISRTAVSVKKMGSFDQGNSYNRYSGNYLQVIKVIRDMKTTHCEILLSENLLKGVTYQLDIPFSGQLSNKKRQAFYHNTNENNTSDERWFIATHMKNGNARRVFPCFDETFFKATFEISIAHPVNMKAISNMPIQSSEAEVDEDEYIWDHFQITPPMSTSSLVIYIFNPTNLFPVSPTVTQGGVRVQGLAQASDLPKAQAVVNYLTIGIGYLERYLGVAFPLPQLTVVFLPDVSIETEDYWGLLLAGNNFQVSVHLLQQWFGHLITPEEKIYENLSNALAHYHAFVCPMEITEECQLTDSPVWGWRYSYIIQYDINDKSSPQHVHQRKMLWLLRMFNYSLTERTFRRGIQNFLKNGAYRTFTEDDLWNALDMQAWTYATLERNISTKPVAKSWINNDHFPVVTVTRNYQNNTAKLVQELFIRRWPHTIPGQKNILWWIPIMYLTQNNLDVNNIDMAGWMKEEREITIEYMPDSNSFIIINPEDIGMFLVNYDHTNWNMLAEYLIASGAGNGQPLIPPATRAKLLHNAWYLALGGRLQFATAFNISLFLKTETEIPIWKSLSQIYFTVSWKFTGTEAEVMFDRFIGELLMKMFTQDDEENLQEYESMAEIHALARYVLCKAGYKVAVERARSEFSKWLQDQKEISDGTLWGVFRWVDEDWERGMQRVLDLLQNETTSAFRGFLLSQLVSSTIEPQKVKRVLIILLLEDYYFTDGEIKEVAAAVTDSKTFLKFLDDNWATLNERFEDRANVWQYILEQATRKFKTQEGYNMVLDFYMTHKHDGNISSVMEHSLQVITVNKEGIYKKLPEMINWMEHYLAQSNANSLFYTLDDQH